MQKENYFLKIIKSLSIIGRLTGTVEINNEEKTRRKLFSVFLTVLIVPFVIFGIIQLMTNHPEHGIPNLIFAAIMAVMFISLKNFKRAVPLYRLIAASAFMLFMHWIITGAADGYASLWVIAFPPYVYFLLGKREGSAWIIALSVLSLLLFLDLVPFLKVFKYPASYIIRLLSTFLLVVLFTYYYEILRDAYKSGMETDRLKLLEERNLLALTMGKTEKTNELLKKEIEKRLTAQEEIKRHRDNLEDIIYRRTEEIYKKNTALRRAFDELEKINTDLKASKDRLAESESRYRLLADNVTDLIWSTDMSLHFIYISPSIKNIYGYTVDEALALPFEKWSTPESYVRAMKIFTKQLGIEYSDKSDPDRYIIIELDQLRKDGTVFPVEIKISFMRDENLNPIGTVGITRDITERVKSQREKENMQAQLSQAQKMEAIGTLVGGLAHDFNNVLGGIIGSFDLIKLNLDREKLLNREEIDSYITLGMESSKRSVNLIKQLLTLSKKRSLALATVDINQSVKHIHDICKNSFPKTVTLDFRTGSSSLYILAEAVQIEQVLLNLCINASHAMTIMRADNGPHGGTLSVSPAMIPAYDALIGKYPEAAAFQKWICVKIEDTGIGMQPDIIGRIFEPFFTTKKQEEGTGLGLSISYSIVKQHRGFISVESVPGKGSVFSVFIPAYESPGGDTAAVNKHKPLVRGSGTILIIDDEQLIINVVRGILTDCGYRILSEASPDKGVALYRERHSEISAVILDLSMPGMSGIEVFQELKKINPQVKAVLASGMLDSDMMEKAAGLGIKYFLHKPFNGEELSSAIEKLLNT